MAKPRRTFTPEFKAEAVKLVTEQGYSIAEAARTHGVHDKQIRLWKQAFQDQGLASLSRRGQPLPAVRRGRTASPPRLTISVWRWKATSKKAAAFFAKEAM